LTIFLLIWTIERTYDDSLLIKNKAVKIHMISSLTIKINTFTNIQDMTTINRNISIINLNIKDLKMIDRKHQDFHSILNRNDMIRFIVEVLNTVTMWIQIYTYRSANWSMILQSSFLLFYIISILKWFEFHQVILWSHLLSSWSYNLINLAFIDRFNQFSWKSRYSRNSRTNYSRIVNDSLNLIRRTRQITLWH
jgi:hypothetical protein